MEKIITLQNLLAQIRIIQKKYDDIAEVTGEHYNVFDVLGLNSDELSHSAIISNLLNAKGKHGQKDLFLKLFIQIVKEKYNLSNFLNENDFDDTKIAILDQINTVNSIVEIEKHVGKVDYETAEGGRIDIIVSERAYNVIIENKIYATDQPQQLVRYYKYDKNAPIFYLTLLGDLPNESSVKTADVQLCNNKDFFLLSYKDDIKNWLELCVKAVYNKPFLRETILQYIYLINELTKQSNNSNMKEEVIKTMISNADNFNAALTIESEIKFAKQQLWLNFGQKVVVNLKTQLPEAIVGIEEKFGLQYQKITLKCPHEHNYFIHFSLLRHYDEPYIEVHPGNEDSGKPLDKNHELRIKLNDLIDIKLKPEDTSDRWQGEWVCMYKGKINNIIDLITKEAELVQTLTTDLVNIYRIFEDEIKKIEVHEKP